MHISKIGRYELRSVLARSAGSIVHEGWDELIGRKVAIKIVPIHDRQDPETREALLRFAQGARAAGILSHPAIVAVYDYGETENAAFLIMEFVEGMTLKALLDTGGALRRQDMLRVMEDMLAGLAHSHRHGIVHRDIKPANIMILADGHAKVTDFGVARIEASSITQTGTIIGTPAYMSPEQFLGEAADLRTDIYSAGAVLYQMLTGHRPFEGSVATIAHKVLHTEPPRPSQVAVGIPPVFDEVVRRAMARNRDQRYASAHSFLDALRAAAADAQAPDATVTRVAGADNRRSESRLRRPPSRGGNNSTILPIIAGGIVGLGLGAFILWHGQLWHGQASAPGHDAGSERTALAATGAPVPPPASQPPASQPSATLAPVAQLPSSATPEHEATTTGTAPLRQPATGTAPPVAPPVGPGDDKPIALPAATTAEVPDAIPKVLREKVSVVALPARPQTPRSRPTPAVRGEQDTAQALLLAPPALVAPRPSAPRPPPPGERPKVHIYYASGSAEAQQMTTVVAQQLLFSDFAYADTRSAAKVPAAAEIRFFHPDDEGAAERLAALLGSAGRDFQIRNWADREVTRPPGTLEVWLGP